MVLRETVGRLPIIGAAATALSKRIRRELAIRNFPGSAAYWEQRYARGGTSGGGSYNRLAEYKAKVLNDFVVERGIADLIEFGCGDGNQLSLARYPKYIGLDVSSTAIALCKQRFAADESKSFYVYDSLSFVDNHGLFRADVSMSLDVIYHLVEDRVFEPYMRQLFAAGRRHVIIYSSDYETKSMLHQRNRAFTAWVREQQPDWQLEAHLPNPYPHDPNDQDNTSIADFYVYSRR
jgi:hypothetical protein